MVSNVDLERLALHLLRAARSRRTARCRRFFLARRGVREAGRRRHVRLVVRVVGYAAREVDDFTVSNNLLCRCWLLSILPEGRLLVVTGVATGTADVALGQRSAGRHFARLARRIRLGLAARQTRRRVLRRRGRLVLLICAPWRSENIII